MAQDLLDYPKLVEDAMRGVIRGALTQVAESGLPGSHHFYITFSTTAPGVEIANVLHAQYPEAMTIVLQHRFWDLSVDADGFSVTLSFGGAQQRLYVPFEAVTGFVDPSVNFGFTFEDDGDAAESGASAPEPGDGPGPPAPKPDASGQVVTLDRFRKK